MIVVVIVTAYIYLPVFFNLQITSTYEYLELRFDNSVRALASFLFGLSIFLFLPIVIYIPALACSAGNSTELLKAKDILLSKNSSNRNKCSLYNTSDMWSMYLLHDNRGIESSCMD